MLSLRSGEPRTSSFHPATGVLPLPRSVSRGSPFLTFPLQLRRLDRKFSSRASPRFQPRISHSRMDSTSLTRTQSLSPTGRPRSASCRCLRPPRVTSPIISPRSDGNYLFVADAGAPYVHVYGREGADWVGVRSPLVSWRVLDQETYLRARVHPTEGGPKGIDIDDDMTVLAVTSALETLNFFDLRPILESASSCRCSHRAANSTRPGEDGQDRESEARAQARNDLALKYELERQDDLDRALARAADAEARADQVSARAGQAEIQVAALTSSTSWVTAPLRLVSTRLRKLKAQLGKALAGGGPA